MKFHFTCRFEDGGKVGGDMDLSEIIQELHDADAALTQAKQADQTAGQSEEAAVTARGTADNDKASAAAAHNTASQMAAKAIADLQAYFGTTPPAPVQPAVARTMRR